RDVREGRPCHWEHLVLRHRVHHRLYQGQGYRRHARVSVAVLLLHVVCRRPLYQKVRGSYCRVCQFCHFHCFVQLVASDA
ncbi:ABC multidrug transporter, partial [Aspergillus sclerotialis]